MLEECNLLQVGMTDDMGTAANPILRHHHRCHVGGSSGQHSVQIRVLSPISESDNEAAEFISIDVCMREEEPHNNQQEKDELEISVEDEEEEEEAYPRFRILYQDEGYMQRSQDNAKKLLFNGTTTESNTRDTSTAILAKKALRYRNILHRMDGVDLNDPTFNVSEFLGLSWRKASYASSIPNDHPSNCIPHIHALKRREKIVKSSHT